ncbi:hypothetical protein Salat_0237600 [Sesamum alatum]|uniref:Uncharacterized protein n=1 Tax=Sesamum alatum TaxID=300844 RepID=A0AAE1YZ92_9LAMI|nr:hypothetical protein Salat_0237600 [Sesamum alatum]
MGDGGLMPRIFDYHEFSQLAEIVLDIGDKESLRTHADMMAHWVAWFVDSRSKGIATAFGAIVFGSGDGGEEVRVTKRPLHSIGDKALASGSTLTKVLQPATLPLPMDEGNEIHGHSCRESPPKSINNNTLAVSNELPTSHKQAHTNLFVGSILYPQPYDSCG